MAEHVSLASERALGATGEWAHMPIMQIFWGFPISNCYSNEEGIWVLGLQRRGSLNLCQRGHLPSHLPPHIEWPDHLPDRGQVAPAHTRNCSIKKTTMRFSCSPWRKGENILNLWDFILQRREVKRNLAQERYAGNWWAIIQSDSKLISSRENPT